MVRNIDELDERLRSPHPPGHEAAYVVPVRRMADVPGTPSFDVTRTERRHVVPESWHDTGRHALHAPMPAPAPAEAPSLLGRTRAWMVVIPVGAALLLVPLAWTPDQLKAIIAMAVLTILLLSGGRYRARLHLSVLDELPSLVTRTLAAAAVVATVIALRHDQEAVTTFLTNAVISLGLVVIGRFLTTCIIAGSRARRTTMHRTVIVGGGPLAAELAQILQRHPRYGLTPIGFVDDGDDGIAQDVIPQLGGLDDLDGCVARAGADVLLVTDDHFSERRLLDVVRTPRGTPRCRPRPLRQLLHRKWSLWLDIKIVLCTFTRSYSPAAAD